MSSISSAIIPTKFARSMVKVAEAQGHDISHILEISEMPLNLQSKLLRVIQEKRVMPIGSSSEVKVDVRIIATTNRNMFDEVKSGNFREDLFYRLNVFPINNPSPKPDFDLSSVLLVFK